MDNMQAAQRGAAIGERQRYVARPGTFRGFYDGKVQGRLVIQSIRRRFDMIVVHTDYIRVSN